MPNALDKKESLFQNLKDAGCDKKLTAECIDSCDKGTLCLTLPMQLTWPRCAARLC